MIIPRYESEHEPPYLELVNDCRSANKYGYGAVMCWDEQFSGRGVEGDEVNAMSLASTIVLVPHAVLHRR